MKMYMAEKKNMQNVSEILFHISHWIIENLQYCKNKNILHKIYRYFDKTVCLIA